MSVRTLLDLIVALGTLVVIIVFSSKHSVAKALQFFTVQSNIYVASVSLVCGIWAFFAPEPMWLLVLKFSATCSVTVTFLTVFLYLGPRFKNWGYLLSGANLWMHLFCPLFAIASLSLRAPVKLPFAVTFAGLAPVILYSLLYLKKVMFEVEEKKWDDLYGFADGIRWVWSMTAMYVASYAVSLGMRALMGCLS